MQTKPWCRCSARLAAQPMGQVRHRSGHWSLSQEAVTLRSDAPASQYENIRDGSGAWFAFTVANAQLRNLIGLSGAITAYCPFDYLPFQFGVRLLRKASMPSRKSSLI